MTGLLTGHCHLKRLGVGLGLVTVPSDRCKHASEMATHALCDSETLDTIRFRHMKQDISVSRVLHFAPDARLLDA